MSVFSEVLSSLDRDNFDAVFKQAVKSLGIEQLRLQQAVKNGSIALAEGVTVMIISRQQSELSLEVKCGFFFHSMIAGCNCADDPSPVDRLEEYAEALFSISKKDGSFTIHFV